MISKSLLVYCLGLLDDPKLNHKRKTHTLKGVVSIYGHGNKNIQKLC